MIKIGVSGFTDHDLLYEDIMRKSDKLKTYASFFPIVELDTAFYAIQPQRNMYKWMSETPDSFQFIVKAERRMTQHSTLDESQLTYDALFEQFIESVKPLVESSRLGLVLMQFPPWFDCRTEHVQYLMFARNKLKGMPVAIEFRHHSWFLPHVKEDTLNFLNHQKLIHAICDEPNVGEGYVPYELQTTAQSAFFRFHGRNNEGWTRKDMTDDAWRAVRFLYDYNLEELTQFAHDIQSVDDQVDGDVYVIFNNNSGGHAAKNALKLIDILNIEYVDLAPRQMKLF